MLYNIHGLLAFASKERKMPKKEQRARSRKYCRSHHHHHSDATLRYDSIIIVRARNHVPRFPSNQNRTKLFVVVVARDSTRQSYI